MSRAAKRQAEKEEKRRRDREEASARKAQEEANQRRLAEEIGEPLLPALCLQCRGLDLGGLLWRKAQASRCCLALRYGLVAKVRARKAQEEANQRRLAEESGVPLTPAAS